MSDWDDIMAQLDVGTAGLSKQAPASNPTQWQTKFLEAEAKLKTVETENAALKERMSRFAIIAEEVRKERRMHQEDLEAERSRTTDAEARADEYETRLIQLATLVNQLKEQHAIELNQARSSSSSSAGNPQQLQDALAQAKKLGERAALAEQQSLALQAKLDSETMARAQAEAGEKKAQETTEGVQQKFMKLAEISKNLRSQNEDLLSQVETLKSAVGKSQTGAQAGAAEIKGLQTKVEQATRDAATYKQKVSDSDARIKVLENEVSTLTVKLKAASDAAAKSSAGASAASANAAQLATMDAELKETRVQRDKALADAKVLDEKFSGLMPKITADRDRSKAEIQALTDKATKLEADLTDVTAKLRTSETSARSARTKLEELQAANKSTGADAEKLQGELDKSKQLTNKLRDELTASKTYVAALEDRVAKAQAQVSAARTEASSAGSGNTSAVEQLKTENASLRDRLTAADSKANQLRQQVHDLEDKLSRAGSAGPASPRLAEPAGAPPPPAPVFDAAGGPPPPPAGGPPPPPPPPPAGGAKSGGPLVITRSAKSTAALAASSSSSSGGGAGNGDAQSALLAAISGGVKLKKSAGPEDTDAKLKRLEAQKRAEAPKGPTGNPLADLSNLGLMAKELALKRTARVQATKEAPTRGRHDPARQSVRLTNLLDGM